MRIIYTAKNIRIIIGIFILVIIHHVVELHTNWITSAAAQNTTERERLEVMF